MVNCFIINGHKTNGTSNNGMPCGKKGFYIDNINGICFFTKDEHPTSNREIMLLARDGKWGKSRLLGLIDFPQQLLTGPLRILFNVGCVMVFGVGILVTIPFYPCSKKAKGINKISRRNFKESSMSTFVSTCNFLMSPLEVVAPELLVKITPEKFVPSQLGGIKGL